MKTKIILIGTLILLIASSGCVQNEQYKRSARLGCIQTNPTNSTAEHECRNLVCEEIGLSSASSGSWTEARFDCQTESGAVTEVFVWNTNIPECQQVVEQRFEIQSCLEQNGGLY